MTPIALWTGRLPGLRPLPRRGALWIASGIVALGVAGSLGALDEYGPGATLCGALTAAWTLLRHRWPTELPMRLRTLEQPQGSDEKAVLVEFRHDGVLLGWDVGILWFEKGGVGFVGRTVSFVLPRALMAPAPPLPALRSLIRAPQLAAQVFEMTVGIVPIAPELRAQMTLARIDALPNAITSETVLPPNTMHPDLLQRGLAVRRRAPFLWALIGSIGLFAGVPIRFLGEVSPAVGLVQIGCSLLLVSVVCGVRFLPRSVRERLPR